MINQTYTFSIKGENRPIVDQTLGEESVPSGVVERIADECEKIKCEYGHYPVFAMAHVMKWNTGLIFRCSFCSPEEKRIDKGYGKDLAIRRCQRAYRQTLQKRKERGDTWDMLITEGLIEGYIPKDKAEVQELREKRKRRRKEMKNAVKVNKLIQELRKLKLDKEHVMLAFDKARKDA